jgi:hypothetical protein
MVNCQNVRTEPEYTNSCRELFQTTATNKHTVGHQKSNDPAFGVGLLQTPRSGRGGPEHGHRVTNDPAWPHGTDPASQHRRVFSREGCGMHAPTHTYSHAQAWLSTLSLHKSLQPRRCQGTKLATQVGAPGPARVRIQCSHRHAKWGF